ncbi:hypothetical protein HBH56_149580 [Parastagonospora nodorum]|uniref:Mid2 domain-containing protein n=2 Tax=Phaeosphaeria nodorum (strain SN15 / ATCC MYA-4574 / FGSC 10173) TaxID=321614 RepID=A0A7U2EW45_PHANO|nr:hypothetical protein HBH56_149580 [Parastagonospora nodorum]QRC94196.1 hypothetical protein JI435_074670 [Parastagonospora nodorum SN15]KAH3928691.1 hypothetical protein HBH54_135480 [Parastagonospora nodorum]KAH3983617.1 hypothetical protein HBH52_062980 [Parastagonospora nodorum]KAH4065671.1 hypothetical protein HBH50_159660 [Parastagonospora nodorum]
MSITTTVGSLPQYIATATVPALTTFFTPPASFNCEDRYVAADTAGIAWSTYSRDGYAPPVDPTYYSCLPERIRGPHFSPGVCTQGQTIASITKYEAGTRTMWQAQCCKSGQSLSLRTIQNSPIPMCVSAISTPLPVRALYTTTYTNGVSSSFYEQVINDQSTVSNMTTMTRGTAIADPLYVAWEAKDLSLFPVAYATSLAQKIGVDFTPTPTPALTNSAGQRVETNPPNTADTDSGLSSGTKIGIGVGAGVGAALLIALIAGFLVMCRLRRRRRAVDVYPNESTPAIESGGVVKSKWYQRGRTQEEMEMHDAGGSNELDSMPVHYVSGEPVELEGEGVRVRY